MMNILVAVVQSKKSKLTVTGDNDVRIKLSCLLSEIEQIDLTKRLTETAKEVIALGLDNTLRGQVNFNKHEEHHCKADVGATITMMPATKKKHSEKIKYQFTV